jgi:hypothetical protein
VSRIGLRQVRDLTATLAAAARAGRLVGTVAAVTR